MKYRKLINEMKREDKDTLAYFNSFECRHYGRHRKVTNLKSEKKIQYVNVSVEMKACFCVYKCMRKVMKLLQLLHYMLMFIK